MGQDTKEVGHEWGFTDPQEATSHKMTLTEYHQWFGPHQSTPELNGALSMIGEHFDSEFYKHLDFTNLPKRYTLPSGLPNWHWIYVLGDLEEIYQDLAAKKTEIQPILRAIITENGWYVTELNCVGVPPDQAYPITIDEDHYIRTGEFVLLPFDEDTDYTEASIIDLGENQ